MWQWASMPARRKLTGPTSPSGSPNSRARATRAFARVLRVAGRLRRAAAARAPKLGRRDARAPRQAAGFRAADARRRQCSSFRSPRRRRDAERLLGLLLLVLPAGVGAACRAL